MLCCLWRTVRRQWCQFCVRSALGRCNFPFELLKENIQMNSTERKPLFLPNTRQYPPFGASTGNTDSNTNICIKNILGKYGFAMFTRYAATTEFRVHL